MKSIINKEQRKRKEKNEFVDDVRIGELLNHV